MPPRHRRTLQLATATFLLAGVATSAQQGAPTPDRLRVQIVDAANRGALRRVRVVAERGGSRGEPIFSDDQGRFTIDGFATRIVLRASKAGYATATVAVAPGSADGELRIPLSPAAAITGRVTDRFGAPLPRAVVNALLTEADGKPAEPVQSFHADTDDLGLYRIGGLPAGRYEVRLVEGASGGAVMLGLLEFRPPGEGPFGGPATSKQAPTFADLRAGEDVDVDLSSTAPGLSCDSSTRGVNERTASGGFVAGRVVSDTGQGLSCAMVRVVGAGRAAYLTSTDSQGRFRLEHLPAGSYRIEASRAGYLAPSPHEGGAAGIEFDLRDGETRERETITLLRGSAITGTITDEYGEPMAGVVVRPLQIRIVNGHPAAVAPPGVTPRRTDDRGRYRLFALPPGRYLVSAATSGTVAERGESGSRGYTPVIYPGVSDAAAAVPVTVDAGRDGIGVDMTFVKSSTATVRGRVTGPAGESVAPAAVKLIPSPQSGSILYDPQHTAATEGGNFVIRGIPPGDYVALATVVNSAGSIISRAHVTVADSDPPPLTITVRPGSTLEGRIVIEGEAPPGDVVVRVAQYADDFDYSLPTGDGSASSGFSRYVSLMDLAGRRRFALAQAPKGWYFKSVLIDNVDAVDTGFDFADGSSYRDVEFVVSSAGAGIDGRVTDDRDRPVRDFAVVVFPPFRDIWFNRSRHVKIVRPSRDGTFSVNGLPPGEYLAAAVDRLDDALDFEWQDPQVLERLSARAEPVTLVAGEHKSLTLQRLRRTP